MGGMTDERTETPFSYQRGELTIRGYGFGNKRMKNGFGRRTLNTGLKWMLWMTDTTMSLMTDPGLITRLYSG